MMLFAIHVIGKTGKSASGKSKRVWEGCNLVKLNNLCQTFNWKVCFVDKNRNIVAVQ